MPRRRREPATEIGAMIRAVRDSRGETVGEFAAAIGCNHQRVSQIERGESAPSLWLVLRIGAVAGPAEKAWFVEHAREFLEAHGVVEVLREVVS